MESVNVDTSKFLPLDFKLAGLLERRCSDPVLLKMLEEGLLADITLKAKGGSVKAHRSVLAGVSPVFNAMFQHNMKETLTSSVDILDMSIDALQLFLLLLYTSPRRAQSHFYDAIDLHLNELFEATRKYQVGRRLTALLQSALWRNLNPHNCWYFLDCSMQFAEPAAGLLDHTICEEYILENYDAIVKSESFLKEMKRHPERVYNLILAKSENKAYRPGILLSGT